MNLLSNNIDIDSHFYGDNFIGSNHGQLDDDYYDNDKFNNTFVGNYNSDLKLIHVNIRSLPRNGNYLIAYLEGLKHKFNVICLTETWLNNTRVIENLFPEYNEYHSMRSPDLPYGGGAAVLVHKDLKSDELSEVSCNTDHIECVFVKICNSSGDVVVGSCYRKPLISNSTLFINSLTEKISLLDPNSKIILTGDFNYNLLQIDTDNTASTFMDSMLTLGLINTITKATRVTDDSFSLLDNIFISNSIAYSSGIFLWDVSDHYPVFAFIKKYIRKS